MHNQQKYEKNMKYEKKNYFIKVGFCAEIMNSTAQQSDTW